MQIVVLKAYRNKISDKRNIGVTQSAPLFYPKAKRISAKSGAILRWQKLARIPLGEQRNFCFAEIRRPAFDALFMHAFSISAHIHAPKKRRTPKWDNAVYILTIVQVLAQAQAQEQADQFP